MDVKFFWLLPFLIFSATATAQNLSESEEEMEIEQELEAEPAPPQAVSPEEPPLAPTEVRSSSDDRPTLNRQSEPRFDWSKYRGQEKVPHPLSEKGLIRITKDKVYIYDTKTSEQKQAVSFRFGYFDPINLENPEASGEPNSTFEENYDETANPTLLVEYEWQLFRFGIGKAGIKVGSGIYFAQGNGHFENPNASPTGEPPRERFTLLVFPNSLGAVARFQIWEKQLLVPYVDGGMIGFTFTEMRDDDRGPKFGGALASYWAVGGQFNMSYFDALSRAQLDREYGINRIYLVGEYRNIISLSDKFDFSSDLINGGFLLEF